jgi:PAS domain S-box-containing protein
MKPDDTGLFARLRSTPSGTLEASEMLVFGRRQQEEFAASPCPMRLFDHETLRYLAVNDAALRLYGYTREEFLTLSVRDTRHADEHSTLVGELGETTGYLKHWGLRRHVTKSGKVLSVETCGQDVWLDGRRARVSLLIDVSDRVRAEAQLRIREQEFKSLAENSPDIVARLDREMRHVYVNPEVTAVTGLSPDAYLGRSIHEVGLPAALAQAWEKALNEVFAGGKRQRLQTAYEGLQGLSHFESHIVPEPDADGKVRTVLSITRNITERRNAEEALRESEARLELAIENSGLGMWDWNVQTGVRRSHRHLAEMLGLAADEAPCSATDWYARVHPADRAQVQAELDRHLSGESGSYQCEYRMKSRSGEYLWLLDRGRVVSRDAQGKPAVMLGGCQDITAHHNAETERLAGVLRQRDALVRDVHHRIKNNLQGVVGLLRQLAGEQPEIEPVVNKAIAQLQAVAIVHGLKGRDGSSDIQLREMLPAIAQSVQDVLQIVMQVDVPADDGSFALLSESEAVPVALIMNELLLNAAKVVARRQIGGNVHAVLRVTSGCAQLVVSNKGALPRGFDFSAGKATGTGLDLVRSLLPPEGAKLTFRQAGGRVEAILDLAGAALRPAGGRS